MNGHTLDRHQSNINKKDKNSGTDCPNHQFSHHLRHDSNRARDALWWDENNRLITSRRSEYESGVGRRSVAPSRIQRLRSRAIRIPAPNPMIIPPRLRVVRHAVAWNPSITGIAKSIRMRSNGRSRQHLTNSIHSVDRDCDVMSVASEHSLVDALRNH